MSWKPEVEEIERLRARALEMGGEEAVTKHRERGRGNVRERIHALVDRDSFRERGQIAGASEDEDLADYQPTSVVLGTAKISSRPVVVCGDDFTIRGGAYSDAGLKKGLYAEELASSDAFRSCECSKRVAHPSQEPAAPHAADPATTGPRPPC